MSAPLLLAQTALFFVGSAAFAIHWSQTPWPVLAQAESSTTALGAICGGFTLMTGLMVWIVKRLLDTTIPGQQTAFQTALDTVQKANLANCDQQRMSFQTAQDHFQAIVEKQQDAFRSDLADVMKQAREDRDFFGRQIDSILKEFREDRDKFQEAIWVTVNGMKPDPEAKR